MDSILDPILELLVWAILLLTPLLLGLLWFWHKRRDSLPDVRPLPAFQDLQDEVKRAAESGKTIHIALGSGGLNGEDAVTSLAGIQVVEALADDAVAYDAAPIITVGDPTLLPLAQDALRRVYERRGLADLYDSNQVRFIAPSPVAYAAGAANVLATEDVTANAMAGAFGAEVSLITDAGARLDLSQLAAAAASDAIGVLYPATGRLAIGEELYAAGAQMTRERRYAVSLVAQDILRILLVLLISGMAVLTFLSSLGILR